MYDDILCIHIYVYTYMIVTICGTTVILITFVATFVFLAQQPWSIRQHVLEFVSRRGDSPLSTPFLRLGGEGGHNPLSRHRHISHDAT